MKSAADVSGRGADGTAAEAGAILTAAGLSCTFDGRTLWRNLALKLRAGERLAVTGPSGTGKTVLLRTLAGLEPVQSGCITLYERLLDAWPMPDYRACVVYLPQRPALREGSVDAALRAPFGLKVRRGAPFPGDTLQMLLQLLGRNTAFLQQRCERLSGGESQLVAVLRALLVAPEILLLDEPTASLDAAAVEAIEKLVTGWMDGAPRRACIWTSHDRAQLARTCNRSLALAPVS